MLFEGDRTVIDLMRARREGRGDEARLMLFITGGLMKGAYGAGAVIALEEAGYTDVFDHVVGVSCGAPIGAYFLAEDTRHGASIFCEECTTRAFISPWRFGKIVDDVYLDSVFRGATGKRIDAMKVLGHRSTFHVALTDSGSAHSLLVQPRTEEELFKTIQSSVHVPGVCGSPLLYEGVSYVDGSFGTPYALLRAVEALAPTHLLVIANQEKVDQNHPATLLERMLYRTIYRSMVSPSLYRSAVWRRIARGEAIGRLVANKRDRMEVAAVWGDGSASSFERSAHKMERAIERSRAWWRELIA